MARFITADSAESKLTVAADGQLPELKLQEGDKKEKVEADESTGVNPLVLFGLITLSVVMSIALALWNPDSESTQTRREKAAARDEIAAHYFGDFDDEEPLERYQEVLREARRAYARGDLKAERRHYREVLDLLRMERKPGEKGVTGSYKRDKELQDHIIILLKD